MDKKSKILISIFLLLAAISAGAAFYRYMILGDISYTTDEEAFQQALEEE